MRLRSVAFAAVLPLLPACGPKQPPVAAAEASGPTITLPCDWEAGTTFSYAHGRQRSDGRNPALSEMRTTTPITVTIARSGNPLGVTYATGTPVLTGPPEAVAALSALYATPMPAMQLELTDGVLTGLLNQGEIVDAAAPMLAGTSDNGEVVNKTLALLRDPVAGKAMLLRDTQQFFALHCVQMSVGQVLEAPTSFPNPFGGDPIPGHSRVELAAYDPAAGTVTFRTRDGVDAAAVGPLLESLFARFAPGPLTPEKRAEILKELPPIESLVAGEMVYSVADGFPLRITVHQETGAAGHPAQRTDDWTWERVTP